MLINLTSKILFLAACVYLTSAQDDPIRDNIEYTNYFANALRSRKTNLEPNNGPNKIKIAIPTSVSQQVVPQNSAENDPFLKELFKEFVSQYMQLSVGENQDNIPPVTTTIPPPPPRVIAVQPAFDQSYIPTPNTAQTQHQRRVQIRRKQPVIVTTQSPVNKDFVGHKESLRQKYFGTNSQKNVDAQKSNEDQKRRQKFFGVAPFRQAPVQEQIKKSVEQVVEIPKQPDQNENLEVNTKPSPNLRAFFSSRFAKPSTAPAPQKKVEEPSTYKPEPEFDEAEFRRQAESAKYEFASEINDNINGQINEREEVRDGLAVKGRYSFSDGYFMRTIHYEADDKGYRVVKEEVIPLDGPEYNPDGNARVSTFVDGNQNNYQITTDDIQKKNRNRFVFEPTQQVSGAEEEY